VTPAATCVFCEIVAGRTPAHVVFEDERFVAFLDARPLFEGHTLLVPREHHEAIWDLPADLAAELGERVQRLSVAVRAATEAHGVFNAVNNLVSQSVPHLHVHIVPRNPKDGLRGFFWPRTTYASADDAADTAAQIRAALGA
jgi:histidine triad (HIT) family protein